jgi:long-chain fatty acid transport protein
MSKNVLALGVASALSVAFAHRAEGAAFALAEQGVSGLGNAYAGAAAAAEDASTVWWNPAGMARLPRGAHVLLGVHGIVPSTKFTNGGSVPAAASNPALVGQGGDAGESAVVPNLFFAISLGPSWSIGLGINVPFGLKTAYDANWIGRFQGIESEVKTLNVNPSVSFKISERTSVGVGLSYQHAEIDLLSAVNYSGLVFGTPLFGAVGAGVEGRNTVGVDGDALGWNIGALFDVLPGTRIGFHYRSSLHYDAAEGSTTFTNVPAAFAASPALAAATSDGEVKLDLETPSSFSISAVQKLGNQWELLADATWTEWSKITQLLLVRTSGPANAQTLDTLTFNFNDTWRYALGVNYKPSGAWIVRAGMAYDVSPVPNAQDRSVRLPDNDRWWFSLGATYRPWAASRFDVGYTFIQFKDADINNDQSARARGIVRGNYEANVSILSLSYQHSF